MKDLLGIVGTLPPTARESKLNEAVRKAKLVVGNKYDVRSVPVLQRFEWKGTSAPAIAALRNAPPAGMRTLMDLWARDDQKGRWSTIGSLPVPELKPLTPYTVMSLQRDGAGLARFAKF